MSRPVRVALWDAINDYAASAASSVYGNTRRQNAVVAVERAVDAVVGQLSQKIEAISADNARLRDVDRQCDWLRAENAGLRKQLGELAVVLTHSAQRIRELEAELRDSVPAAKVRDVLSYLELERDFYDQDADSDDVCCGRSLGLDQAIVHVRAVLRGSEPPQGEVNAPGTDANGAPVGGDR